MEFICPSCKGAFEAARPDSGEVLRCPHCEYRFADDDPTVVDEAQPLRADNLPPSTNVAGFRVDELIGRGSMGVVYRATQLSLDRTVALKVLPPNFADNEKFVERFYEESGALSALNHPNIVTIYERGHMGKTYFFAMEYVDGPPLRDMLEEPLDVRALLHIAKGTASALSYAHARGVVHRDVKPSNIVLNSRDEVKIADFGLAGLIRQDSSVSEAGSTHAAVMGTPAYMSPEQKQNSLAVDGRSDIFSAGVVFYEAMAGQKPEIPLERSPSEVEPTADPRLDPIVARCLEQKAEDRYQTADELLADLERISAEIADAPCCHECGTLNPVRFEVCKECGADLDELFDICPECKGKNRREVRACLHCGTDLEKGRTLITSKVTMMLDQADQLRLNGNYIEALDILEEVQAIEGRAFEAERERARVLRKTTVAERLRQAKSDYAEARRLVQQGRFQEAIELFERVPADIKDTTKEIQTARELKARLAAELRNQSTTNLILLLLCLVLAIVVVLLAVV